MKKILFYISITLSILLLISLIFIGNDEDIFYYVYIPSTITTTNANASQYYSKYHRAGCNYLLSTPRRVTLKYAKEHGYTECQECAYKYSEAIPYENYFSPSDSEYEKRAKRAYKIEYEVKNNIPRYKIPLEKNTAIKTFYNVGRYIAVIYLFLVIPIYLSFILNKKFTKKASLLIAILNMFGVSLIIFFADIANGDYIIELWLPIILTIVNYFILSYQNKSKEVTNNGKV